MEPKTGRHASARLPVLGSEGSEGGLWAGCFFLAGIDSAVFVWYDLLYKSYLLEVEP